MSDTAASQILVDGGVHEVKRCWNHMHHRVMTVELDAEDLMSLGEGMVTSLAWQDDQRAVSRSAPGE